MIHPAVSWYIGASYCGYFVKFTSYLTLKVVANCNKRTNASLDPGIVAITHPSNNGNRAGKPGHRYRRSDYSGGARFAVVP